MTVARVKLTFNPGQSSLGRNQSMDGLPLRSADPDSGSIEEDQLLPTSPVHGPARAESVSSTDVPRCAPLDSDDEELPDLPPPKKTTKQKRQAASKALPPPKQTRARSKPKPVPKPGPATGKATRNQRAGPKRNLKGKQKAAPIATEEPPLPSSPSPTPEPPKKRVRSSGKIKETPGASVSTEPALPSPPPNIIAHVELQQALPAQQTARPRRNLKQPPIQNLRLPSFAFPINASYSQLREHLAQAAQVSPLFVSQDITWKFMAPASSSVQPLNSDVCMEALRQQIEKRMAKGQELVVLIVMGPTLSGSTVAASVPPPNTILPASTEDRRDQSRVASVDQRIQDAAKMVSDHYPVGRCPQHPDIACVCHENLHWELDATRCKVWGNKILAGEATLDHPPVGSVYFRVTDVIKNRPPPKAPPSKAPPPSPTPATPTPTAPAGPSSVINSPFPVAFPSPVTGMFHPTWPNLMPSYQYMPYPPALPYPPAFAPQPQPQFSGPSPLAWPPISAQNPPSSPTGPSCDFDRFCDAAKLGPEDRDRLQEMDFVPGQKLSKISKETWDNAGIRPLTLQRIKEADRRRKLGELS